MFREAESVNNICISKLIIPGSLVSFRISKQASWTLNIVSKCGGDTINLPLSADLMKACLFIGTNVDIKYNNDYFEYIINGSIVKIELSGSPYIKVKINKIVENVNHRFFPRLDVCLPAAICSADNTFYCNVTNLSLGGTAFLIDKEISLNSTCEINILLEYNSSVYARGTILRSSKEDSLHKYSMMFTFMEEENSNRLYSYLYNLEFSYNSLRSKYL